MDITSVLVSSVHSFASQCGRFKLRRVIVLGLITSAPCVFFQFECLSLRLLGKLLMHFREILTRDGALGHKAVDRFWQ